MRVSGECSCRVNGDYWVKDSDASVSYHTWGSLVERASHDSLIAPGDVLGCGTVGGGSIGEAIRKGIPQARFLQPGDVVEMDVEALGVLRATIGAKPQADPNYRYPPKEQPALPDRGSVRDYRYELKLR